MLQASALERLRTKTSRQTPFRWVRMDEEIAERTGVCLLGSERRSFSDSLS